MAVLLITHDLGVAAQLCDELLVLYAGRVCERGRVEDVFCDPRHGYTRALLACAPSLEGGRARARPIPGAPPDHAPTAAGLPLRAALPPRRGRLPRADGRRKSASAPGHFAACHFAKGR